MIGYNQGNEIEEAVAVVGATPRRDTMEVATVPNKPTIPLICAQCGTSFLAEPYQVRRGRRLCSRFCANKGAVRKRGSDNAQWRGGICHRPGGYISERCPKHPFADSRGYVAQHRLVMERHL